MKIIYQDKEVGMINDIKKVIDMFKDNIRLSPKHIIACRCNNEVKSLDYEINEGDSIELLDITSKDGRMVYIRGILYIMAMAFNKLYPEAQVIVNFQLTNSMFCEVENMEITDEVIENVKNKMQEIIDGDLPITKKVMTRKEAEEFYDKEKSIRGILQLSKKEKEEITFYFCEDYYNYFYGVMPISTGFVDIFDVKKYKTGFIVRYPSEDNTTEIGPFKETKKLHATLKEYDDINSLMRVKTIFHVNNEIEKDGGKNLILTSEALLEKKIAEISDMISKREGLKMILIAGPSSSGKTTFAKRLGIQLKVNGLKPVTIGTDNYFVERPDTPRDENGDYDFETIDALDLKLFNDHLTRLINGERVEVPVFDFKVGTKRYDGTNFLSLADDEVLVIEGIHCLNDRLTSAIPKENKFKIYISDLTVLNVDYFNRISTTDTRLIRRIVRDYNYRGYSALDTLSRWASVNNGENKNIFPYQEEANVMFNSSLVYELSVLSKYAIPLLKEIGKDKKEYSEAKRLISFLQYFKPIEDESAIPNNSVLREFIGGSVFEY